LAPACGRSGFVFAATAFKLDLAGEIFSMDACRRAIAVALVLLSTASTAVVADENERTEPDIDMFASMAGTCSTLKVADRDFVCTSVAFFHSPGGRSSFAVPLNDPDDAMHIITFSGDKARRVEDSYELTIDRMLLKSKDRPRADGLPVPLVVPSSGSCQQVGKFSAQQVSSVACDATDANGVKYQFQFASDGSPIRVTMIRVSDQPTDARRAKEMAAHIAQLRCRQLAEARGILPRDRTDFILQCMEE
jgi:hypothetical protein